MSNPGKFLQQIKGIRLQRMTDEEMDEMAYGKKPAEKPAPAPRSNIPGTYLTGDIIDGGLADGHGCDHSE